MSEKTILESAVIAAAIDYVAAKKAIRQNASGRSGHDDMPAFFNAEGQLFAAIDALLAERRATSPCGNRVLLSMTRVAIHRCSIHGTPIYGRKSRCFVCMDEESAPRHTCSKCGKDGLVVEHDSLFMQLNMNNDYILGIQRVVGTNISTEYVHVGCYEGN